MTEDSQRLANFRVNLVAKQCWLWPTPWQQAVWLDPSTFENLDHIFHVLFDDFCDADQPEQYLGISLRTDEEVTLMRQLGSALNAADAEAPNDTDQEYLQATTWPEVVAVAYRLAQVMVSNDLSELVALHSTESVETATATEADGQAPAGSAPDEHQNAGETAVSPGQGASAATTQECHTAGGFFCTRPERRLAHRRPAVGRTWPSGRS